MTLRLDAEEAKELALVARIDGQNVSDFVRIAVKERLAARLLDPDFQEKRSRLEADEAAVFEGLSGNT